MSREHDTVGWRFKAGGVTYRCTRYTPSGYDMKMVGGHDPLFPRRAVGDVVNVSERAIDRTFHRIRGDGGERPSRHQQPCVCWVCRGRSAP